MAIWAWMRWRETRRTRWALLLGAAMGWAAVTRPFDAICYAVPIGLGLLWELRRSRARAWLVTSGALIAAAAPFLALQLWFNHGVTGSVLQTPAGAYARTFHPGAFLLSKPPPAGTPSPTSLPQKRRFYEQFLLPMIRQHNADGVVRWVGSRAAWVIDVTLPASVLVLLMPVGLLAARDARQWLIIATLPLFLVAYALNAVFIPQYTLVVIPAVILLVVLGVNALAAHASADRKADVEVLLSAAVLTLALSALPPLNRKVRDDAFDRKTMFLVARELPKRVRQPALVLFTFHPRDNVHEEPVYNFDVAWPDDAPIIRAHNLDYEKNRKLVKYYAQRQPQRHVYVVDRAEILSPKYLGTVGELWAQLQAEDATSQPATAPASTAPSSGPATVPAGGRSP
jgi:hypothetical protein